MAKNDIVSPPTWTNTVVFATTTSVEGKSIPLERILKDHYDGKVGDVTMKISVNCVDDAHWKFIAYVSIPDPNDRDHPDVICLEQHDFYGLDSYMKAHKLVDSYKVHLAGKAYDYLRGVYNDEY